MRRRPGGWHAGGLKSCESGLRGRPTGCVTDSLIWSWSASKSDVVGGLKTGNPAGCLPKNIANSINHKTRECIALLHTDTKIGYDFSV